MVAEKVKNVVAIRILAQEYANFWQHGLTCNSVELNHYRFSLCFIALINTSLRNRQLFIKNIRAFIRADAIFTWVQAGNKLVDVLVFSRVDS